MTAQSRLLSGILIPVFALGLLIHASANPLRAPDEKSIAEARQLVEAMKQNPRGPYRQIRWFCNDGTTHPPRPYACAERGGGTQHAEYSDQRDRLQELGWSVGTIFTALEWEKFWDIDRNHLRMRELPLEKYLVDIDNGWVLEKAKYYRGRVQIESEEKKGRDLLIKLVQQPGWAGDNYLLMRELVRTIPHSGVDDSTRDIRRISQNIAEQESRFQNLRIEIHTSPSVQTIVDVKRWARDYRSDQQPEIIDQVQDLIEKMEHMYGEAGRKLRLEHIRNMVRGDAHLQELHLLISFDGTETGQLKIEKLGRFLSSIRNAITLPVSATKKIQLLDVISDIESEIQLTVAELLEDSRLNRRQLLDLANSLALSAYGSGYLSGNEMTVLKNNITSALEKHELEFEDYQSVIKYLNLASAWALGTVRYTFTEPLLRYTALDPRAGKFVDDLLRGSPLLNLANITRQLAVDAQNISRVQKNLFGKPAPALMALNPGIATGPLYIATEEEIQNGLKIGRENIVVLPQTVSELPPISGVMTVGESNMLSHVQLLARNFGIPNIAVSQAQMNELAAYHGQQVVVAAASDGSVFISTFDDLSESRKQRLNMQSTASQASLTAPLPDLGLARPLPIGEIDLSMSGKIVGPKAANLSNLYKLFPGKVAPAIALPFGLFYREVNRHDETNWNKLQTIYTDFRSGLIDQAGVTSRLDQLRNAVLNISPGDPVKAELLPMMQALFGQDGSYGVFIRSDTNVEDLPGFTGAGLSETLPHLVGTDRIISSIPRVWASVLSPRAIAWRSNLLTNPEQVYPSVLLMKSVPADKSGVLVTRDLNSRKPGLTVSTAWGVGGAVNGETTETLVLTPDGGEVLLSEAKTAYHRYLLPGGGVSWKPARSGSILTPSEKLQLRNIASEINEKYGLARDDDGNILPWDIEFGFVDGELQLFQIRPLIERGQVVADRFIYGPEQNTAPHQVSAVNLDEEIIENHNTVETL